MFQTRGVVLTPDDLTLSDWPSRASAAGLTTIALHPTPSIVQRFIRSDAGSRFLGECRRLGLHVEYELHSMAELLPRSLFHTDPTLFRMDKHGQRVADSNLCVSSQPALKTAAEHALLFAADLPPTGPNKRFFFWGDDGAVWCRCPACGRFSDSDQALILGNHLAGALRKRYPSASVAHLAYANTLSRPESVKPAPGVFLEFAPIDRRYDVPLDDPANRKFLDALVANLSVFGKSNAQALEYWLDVSRFSKWKKPAVKLPWNRDIVKADLAVYASRGIRHITSFRVYIDADYVRSYGEPPIREYGALLRKAG